MDTRARRALLGTAPNPGGEGDYLVLLAGRIPCSGDIGPTTVTLRYVPDRLLVRPATFGTYLEALGAEAAHSLEEVAVTILDDINNELVARWAQVMARVADSPHPGIDSHTVLLEDRQPRWENPDLLGRLQRY